MTTKSRNSKESFSSKCTAVANGIDALSDPTVLVDGQVMPKAQAVAPLLAYPPAVAKTVDAHAAYRQALLDERAAEALARERVIALEAYLKVRVGAKAPALESHGVSPAKPPKRTAAEKAAAAAQAKATREARHVMGPKQRKAIKAPPVPTAVAPAAAPPATAPSMAPVMAPAMAPKPSNS